ncbi:hypothetical protein [Marivita sp.]|uniref:hypothetical protein n=1 Tax=Marivita sp. TaxID=2003365 RepID=UPI003A88B121
MVGDREPGGLQGLKMHGLQELDNCRLGIADRVVAVAELLILMKGINYSVTANE